MNVREIREVTRRKLGLTARGATGKTRFLDVVNMATRAVFKGSPDVFFRDWWRFRLDTTYTTGTLNVHDDDALVFVLASQASGTLPVDGTLRARWLEIVDASGDYHYRRIRDVWVGTNPKTAASVDLISVDRPWANTTDTALSYRIYTDEYPYPRDVNKVFRVLRSPETTPVRVTEAVHPEEMDNWRIGQGWRSEGIVEKYGPGNSYKMVAPHDTPTVNLTTGVAPDKWGWDSGNVNEHDATFVGERFEAAGTFSYCYCYVWGRRRDPAFTRGGDLEPFYISAPSEVSAQQTTTWDSNAIEVYSQHAEYVFGYGLDSTLPSFNRAGIEKFWFRARHATESPGAGTNNAYAKRVESDGVFYLWRITEGSVTSVTDRGDTPPEKEFPLKPWSGDYRHVLFDRLANDTTSIQCRVKRMPDLHRYDTDALHVPDECYEALIAKVCEILAGDRGGDMAKKAAYEDEFDEAMNDLRANYTFMNAPDRPFGNGLGRARRRFYAVETITDST